MRCRIRLGHVLTVTTDYSMRYLCLMSLKRISLPFEIKPLDSPANFGLNLISTLIEWILSLHEQLGIAMLAEIGIHDAACDWIAEQAIKVPLTTNPIIFPKEQYRILLSSAIHGSWTFLPNASSYGIGRRSITVEPYDR